MSYLGKRQTAFIFCLRSVSLELIDFFIVCDRASFFGDTSCVYKSRDEAIVKQIRPVSNWSFLFFSGHTPIVSQIQLKTRPEDLPPMDEVSCRLSHYGHLRHPIVCRRFSGLRYDHASGRTPLLGQVAHRSRP